MPGPPTASLNSGAVRLKGGMHNLSGKELRIFRLPHTQRRYMMKNKFIGLAKKLAAFSLAGVIVLAPASSVFADQATNINNGGAGIGYSVSIGSNNSVFEDLSLKDGEKALLRSILDSSKGNDMMRACFGNRRRMSALNAKKKIVAAMDNLAVEVNAIGKNGKSSFQQSTAAVYGTFDVIRGKAATKNTKFSVRVRLLDKDGKVLESQKLSVSKPSKSGGKTKVVFTGKWDGKSGQVFVSAGKQDVVCVSYPKSGQKLQFTLLATGVKNNTSVRTYTLARILTGKKAATDRQVIQRTNLDTGVNIGG